MALLDLSPIGSLSQAAYGFAYSRGRKSSASLQSHVMTRARSKSFAMDLRVYSYFNGVWSLP
jgi:hypothetical protein